MQALLQTGASACQATSALTQVCVEELVGGGVQRQAVAPGRVPPKTCRWAGGSSSGTCCGSTFGTCCSAAATGLRQPPLHCILQACPLSQRLATMVAQPAGLVNRWQLPLTAGLAHHAVLDSVDVEAEGTEIDGIVALPVVGGRAVAVRALPRGAAQRVRLLLQRVSAGRPGRPPSPPVRQRRHSAAGGGQPFWTFG